ncbi:MAG: hypothetical protein WBA28_08035 [Microbacteriaceae bacterium]
MKKLFSARSPLWQISIYSCFVVFGILILLDKEQPSVTGNFNSTMLILSAIVFALGITYCAQIFRFNKKHPKNMIRYWGLLPPEFKEEDEGMAMVTARATRNVYIFHASALPMACIAYIFFLPSALITFIGLSALLLGHFIVYWVSIWPAWSEK